MQRKTIGFLEMEHGLNDLIAGFVIRPFVNLQLDILQTGIAIIVSNFVVFDGQYSIAM